MTGAAGGLGRPMVLALAAAGADVAIHHLGQPDQAAALAAEVTGMGQEAVVVDGDVTDWDAAAGFVAAVEQQFDGLDIVVNNAGCMTPGRVTEMTLQQWRQTIDIDLTGVFIVSRQAVPGMLQRGRGVIINLSSQLAYRGAEDYSSYCAAKAGVLGLTRAMARELGPTIRVNAIAPGPMVTPMTASTFDAELTRQRTDGLVAGRMGQADEIAPSVVFLASDAASFVHGQTLHVNGGGVMS